MIESRYDEDSTRPVAAIMTVYAMFTVPFSVLSSTSVRDIDRDDVACQQYRHWSHAAVLGIMGVYRYPQAVPCFV